MVVHYILPTHPTWDYLEVEHGRLFHGDLWAEARKTKI